MGDTMTTSTSSTAPATSALHPRAVARERLELLLCLAAAALYMAWFAWPLLWAGSENARLVHAIFIDEGISLTAIITTLDNNSLWLQHRSYGHLYLNMALLPLLVLQQFTDVSEQTMTVTLRLIAAVAGVATIGATFLLARRFFGSMLAWAAAILLATLPIGFLRYATLSRSDTVQLCCLVAAIYACCRLAEEGGRKWLLLASLAAGLACAAKYSGLFVLPIIWLIVTIQIFQASSERADNQPALDPARFIMLARTIIAAIGTAGLLAALIITPDFATRSLTVDGSVHDPGDLQALQVVRLAMGLFSGVLIVLAALPLLWSSLRRQPLLTDRLSRAASALLLSGLVFAAAFVLTAPASIWQLDFVRAFVFQTRNKAFGLNFVEQRSGLNWLAVLSAPPLLSRLLLALLLLSLLCLIATLIKHRWQALLQPAVIIWCWVAIHMSLLLLVIRHFAPQYVLPAIPFLIILALWPISLLARAASERYAPRYGRLLAAAALCIILAVQLPGAWHNLTAYRSETSAVEQRPAVQVGRWLEQHYPAPAAIRIIYDYPAYVPPAFSDSSSVVAGKLSLLEGADPPDVVVVSQSIASQFRNQAQAASYFLGAEQFEQSYTYYEALRAGRFGYVLAYDSRRFQVYERQSP